MSLQAETETDALVRIMDRVARAIERINLNAPVDLESDLYPPIIRALTELRIDFEAEVKLGRGNRVDFLTSDGIAIEVKKGKPNSRQVTAQIKRYAVFPRVTGIIIVVERSIAWHPVRLADKPVRYIGLNRMRGPAI